MTDRIQEQISALVDDEIRNAELKIVIAELTKNPESAERWLRYNLISDALRNNLPDAIEPELAHRIQLALESEPTVLAPQRMRIPEKIAPALKQVGGMAVAASVAVVMVISLQEEQSGVDAGQQVQQQTTALPSAPTTLVADIKQPAVQIQPQQPMAVSSRPVLVAETDHPHPAAVSPRAFDPRFESYLINHSEYAVTTGILPYTQVVGSSASSVQRANGE